MWGETLTLIHKQTPHSFNFRDERVLPAALATLVAPATMVSFFDLDSANHTQEKVRRVLEVKEDGHAE